MFRKLLPYMPTWVLILILNVIFWWYDKDLPEKQT